MASGGIAFTKSMRDKAGARPPLASCRSADVSVDEAYSSLPFTSTGTATGADIAVVSIVDSGIHWVVAAASPSPAAGTGVPVIGPGTFFFLVEAGDKIGIAA